MNKDMLVRQLMALGNLLNTAGELINSTLIMLEEENNKVCNHAKKQDFSTMGRENWVCLDCGYTYDSLGGENG